MDNNFFALTKINRYLMYILLFFGLFDTARNYTVLPLWFGYIKDISLFLIIALNFNKFKFPKNIGIGFYIWFLAVLLFSPLGFVNAEYEQIKIIIACIKYTELFIIFLVFFNQKKIFDCNIEHFVKIYVYGSLILGFVNILGYLVDNPFVSPNLANENMTMDNYRGRMTIGQPAVAIFPIIISFVYLILENKDFISYWLANILFVFIILSTSNTGLCSIIAVLIMVGLYCIFVKHDKALSIMLFIYLIATLLAIYYFVFVSNIYDIDFFDMYTNKILAFFNDSGDIQMNIRYENWLVAISKMQGYDFLYGLGACGFYTFNKIQLIENTYVSTYVMYGLIGLIGMSLFWVKTSFYYAKKCLKKERGLFGLSVCIIYMLHMVTLDLYLLYMLVFPIGLFFNYTIQQDSR